MDSKGEAPLSVVAANVTERTGSVVYLTFLSVEGLCYRWYQGRRCESA